VHIAAIAPAQLLQALLERRDPGLIVRIIGSRGQKHADAPHAVALLCARRKRPRYGRATEKSDEVAPLHVAPRFDSEPSTLQLGGELK
jgi:hypothetical protein